MKPNYGHEIIENISLLGYLIHYECFSKMKMCMRMGQRWMCTYHSSFSYNYKETSK